MDPEAKRISLSVREALAEEALDNNFSEEIPGGELEAPAEEAPAEEAPAAEAEAPAEEAPKAEE